MALWSMFSLFFPLVPLLFSAPCVPWAKQVCFIVSLLYDGSSLELAFSELKVWANLSSPPLSFSLKKITQCGISTCLTSKCSEYDDVNLILEVRVAREMGNVDSKLQFV